jgi:hypothetical protein
MKKKPTKADLLEENAMLRRQLLQRGNVFFAQNRWMGINRLTLGAVVDGKQVSLCSFSEGQAQPFWRAIKVTVKGEAGETSYVSTYTPFSANLENGVTISVEEVLAPVDTEREKITVENYQSIDVFAGMRVPRENIF